MGLYLQHQETKFQVGDTVKVHRRIAEGGKERIQIFEGLVIKAKGHEGEKSFTVRKISSGLGVELIMPIDSPFLSKVEVVSQGLVKRAKLYYLRNRTGRLALKVKTKYVKKEGSEKTAAKPKADKPATAAKPAKKAAGSTGRGTSKKVSSK